VVLWRKKRNKKEIEQIIKHTKGQKVRERMEQDRAGTSGEALFEVKQNWFVS